MRVHELAKELRLTSKQLVAKLAELGFDGKRPSSGLDSNEVSAVRQAVYGAAPKKAARPALPPAPGAAPSPGAAAAAAMARQKAPSLAARRTAASQAKRAQQAAISQARRRAPGGSPVAAAAMAERMRRARSAQLPAADEAEPAAAVETAESQPVPEAPSVLEPRQPGTERARRGRPGAKKGRDGGEELVVPTIEVMKLDSPRRGGGGRKRGGKGRLGAKRGEEGEGRPGARRAEGPGSRIAPRFIYSTRTHKPALKKTPKSQKSAEPKIVRIKGDVTVGQFAEKTGISIADLMKSLMANHGQMLTLNQNLPPDLVELLALEFNVEVNLVEESDESDVASYLIEDSEEQLKPRPPVVTVMGHVDHGKTSLLDAIRQANVVAGEYGGITQHIGAYHVNTPGGTIVFLDTPGHEAFTSMRARGAQITDIVVLVVAADDPIMPQTIEAINHATEAGVPIIVAINKIDLPTANINRISADLMGQGLIPETQGGEQMFCHVSAKSKTGIAELLEAVNLQAEMLELKANPNRRAAGVIIEAHNDPKRGAVSTVLVQKGTLKIGDAFVVGRQYGRIKAMQDDQGLPRDDAGPSMPVEILGLGGVPEAGDVLLVMPSEKDAREVADLRADRRRARGLEMRRHVSLENLKDRVDEGEIKELRIILKADVQGSLGAIREALERILHEEIKIRILHSGAGGVNESDVTLADASDAIIVAFNVRPDAVATSQAHSLGIEIKSYQVIYDLLDDIKAAMAGMLDKRYKENVRGRVEVREVFRVSKVGNVAGCYVASGEVKSTSRVRLLRDNVVIYDGRVASLRRFKDSVSSVQVGLECGIEIRDFHDVKAGDELEVYELEEVPVEI
jgi:translation initiation factor IF-2